VLRRRLARSFFDNIDRFMAPDYIASYQVGSATRVVNFFDENSPSPKKDVLRARVRTTGIQESVRFVVCVRCYCYFH
jgi:hypothetical protein